MHQIDPIKRERATAVLVHFCHTKSRFQEKKIFWALPWENLRLLMWPKNPISSYFGQNSEMQNCQDYTDPTVPKMSCSWTKIVEKIFLPVFHIHPTYFLNFHTPIVHQLHFVVLK